MPRIDTRLKDWDKSEINLSASRIIQRRRRMVQCPWSEDPHGFYLSCFPREVHAALNTLQDSMGGKFSDLINKDEKAVLKLKVDGADSGVVIKFGGERHCVPSGYYCEDGIVIKQQHPAYDALAKFSVDWKRALKEEAEVETLVYHVTNNCNTYGQIHRVWPELLPTIGGVKVQAAENQKRKSSLPADLNIDRVIRDRDEFTLRLAQGALLPTGDPVSYTT